MRVILVTNYDLSGILESLQQEQGNAPAQHLWGYTYLNDHDVSIEILPFEKYTFLKRISEKLKVLGDLDQQLRLLIKHDQYDVIYSAHNLTTLFISFLRLLRILKKPIVTVAYQAPREKNFYWKLFVKLFIGGNDKVLCLSEALLNDLEEFGVSKQKLELIEWGTDLKFYNSDSLYINQHNFNQHNQFDGQNFIFSPGKTYRDYPTLLQAFTDVDWRLTICGAGKFDLSDSSESIPSNVTIIPDMIDWRDFIKLYQQAYAVAIPLVNDTSKFKNAIGLTALTEAMATGKAIVMTRNDYAGVDLEREGIGIWVDPGDVEGWRKAISYLLEHPEVNREMGKKARLLAEKKFNLELFSKKLAKYLQQAYDPRLT